MKQKLLVIVIFLVSIQAFAQGKKWSLETNYSVVPAEGFGGDDNIIDLGLKYRFGNVSFFNFGFSFNGGFSRVKSEISEIEFNQDLYYFQPRVFMEAKIPRAEKLRPSLGLGYSAVYVSSNLNSDVIDNLNPNFTVSAFNFNLGLSYDISKSIFIQAQYDVIFLMGENLNNIKLGVGFRF